MSSPTHCGAHCCGSRLSPFPELLASNDMPTDSQAADISSAIERARTDLISFQRSIEAFIQSHAAILAPIRRVPNEILAELFAHCVDVTKPLDPLAGDAWVISRVCRRWRAVALACPELWSHFAVSEKPMKHLQDFICIQLERVPHPAPLYIRFRDPYTPLADIMDLFLAVHDRWQDVAFFSHHNFTQFVEHACRIPFPRLRKLQLYSSVLKSLQKDETTFDIVDSFPALVEVLLELRYRHFPSQLHLPWSQLRRCTLWEARTSDVLRILALLPTSSSASVLGAEHDRFAAAPPSPTESQINSLELDYCHPLFNTNLFGVLRAPALKKLALNHGYQPACRPSKVLSFLGRSGCALEHLRVQGGVNSRASVLGFLAGVNELERLDVDGITDLPEVLEALGSGTGEVSLMVPNLKTLAVRATSALEGLDVLRLLESRNPTVRKVSFDRWKWEFPDSPEIGERLDVVILV
ncbi:hypothetical protein FB45DRAFT_1055377 [Roridomyces roridus]|uniref:F-box domain-containing protein n=1 Tax=Roridomyces roridus TaxID=1738132 RepID=A0AAD7C5B3_9AGAR|nr:hypothetical protein FB45DRAFT_1055377 [Roridomyces roridus]